MVKKSKVFKPGDYVFAKVKGYPAWPAKVNELNGKKYNIYFFGTGETGNLPANDLFDYFQNKQQFLAKAIKRRDYNDGLTQIEEEITSLGVKSNDNVSGDISQNTSQDDADTTVEDGSGIDASVGDEKNATEDGNKSAESEKDKDGDEMEVDEPTLPETGDSIPNIIEEPKDNEQPATVELAQEKDGENKEGPTKSTPGRGRKLPTPKTPKAAKTPKKSLKPETPKPDTVVESTTSRSGRKIKPKRYLDEQDDEAPGGKKSKITEDAPEHHDTANGKAEERTKNIVIEKKGKKSAVQNGDAGKDGNDRFSIISATDLQDGTVSKNVKEGVEQKENILLCVLPSGKVVGLKLYQNRPQTFGSPEAQKIWENNMAKNSLKLKSQLENGEITPESILAQVETDLSLNDEEKMALKKEREAEIKKDNLNFFRNENKLLDLETRIRAALSFNEPEVTLCSELLAQMAELEVRPIMLIKHPGILEAVKRMRKYTGNLKQWNLPKEEETEFLKKAHILRKRAEHCYNIFKSLFTIEEGRTFLESFSDLVFRFKECTKDYAELDLLEITKEPPGMWKPGALTMKAAAEELEKEKNEEETTDKTAKDKPSSKGSSKDGGRSAKKDKK